MTHKNTLFRSMIVLFLMIFFGCGGGGGGGDTSSATVPVNTAQVAATWGGIFTAPDQINSVCDPVCRNAKRIHAVIFKLDQNGTNISGSYLSGLGGTGTLGGSVNGNALKINLNQDPSTNCPGTFSGSGNVLTDLIYFNYSGSDCKMSVSNEIGNITRLPNIPGQGGGAFSGQWWAENDKTVIYISLSTSDGKGYSGTMKVYEEYYGYIGDSSEAINKVKSYTAELSGTLDNKGIGTINISNVQGSSYNGTIVSGKLTLEAVNSKNESFYCGYYGTVVGGGFYFGFRLNKIQG